MMVLGTLAILPAAEQVLSGGRMAAAARDLATTFHGLRWKSVARNRSHGLLFERDSRGWYWYEVEDGNGNGLRTAEVGSGTDPTLSGPHRMEERVHRVTPGFPSSGPFPRISGSGAIGGLNDPIKFGPSNLISFSPLGTSSSGTVYLTDGKRELFGVVLFGPTGRVRVWRFQSDRGRWRL